MLHQRDTKTLLYTGGFPPASNGVGMLLPGRQKRDLESKVQEEGERAEETEVVEF